MNSNHHKLVRTIFICLLVLIHITVIISGGYFLSPEFTLYPYLVSRGFLPYVNIIDQHFPSLIFGPLSFPSWLTTNPFPLLIIFCLITALTDIFFFFSLVRSKNKKPLLWLLIWIVISYWFSGNTLWLESFITLYLAIILFFGKTNKSIVRLVSGFFFAMILLVKPTLLPLLFLLFIYQKLKLDPYFLAGLLLPLLTTALFLFRFGIVTDFLNLTVTFNREFYTKYAIKAPNLRQIIETSIIFVPSLIIFFHRRKFLSILIIIFAAILVFPRFEYIHLQPALFLLIFLLSKEIDLSVSFFVPFLSLLLVLFVYRNFRHNFGNFYIDRETIKIASILKTKPGNSLYIMGGNDLLYPLTNRVPPWLTYLPSLPWYWHDEILAKRMIAALAWSPETLILIKSNATLDGVNINKSAGLIGQFVTKNYQLVETIESYQVYQRILK